MEDLEDCKALLNSHLLSPSPNEGSSKSGPKSTTPGPALNFTKGMAPNKMSDLSILRSKDEVLAVEPAPASPPPTQPKGAPMMPPPLPMMPPNFAQHAYAHMRPGGFVLYSDQ